MSRAQAESFLVELEQIGNEVNAPDAMSRLSDLAQDIKTASLPAHHRTKLIRNLTELEKRITLARASDRRPASPTPPTESSSSARSQHISPRLPVQPVGTEQTLSFTNQTVRTRDFDGLGAVLMECSGCPLIELQGSLKYLRVYRSQNITVVAENVESSVTLDECRDCSFHIRCQQLRTHNLTDCGIYGLVKQPPLMEDCRDCIFGETSGLLGGRQTGGRIMEGEEL